ncbi:MAG: hypothetical protein M1831_002802 [Alyxoria varia]|nr:MAG: hypothetical protein M1831_002802 [Alyxoria varia]
MKEMKEMSGQKKNKKVQSTQSEPLFPNKSSNQFYVLPSPVDNTAIHIKGGHPTESVALKEVIRYTALDSTSGFESEGDEEEVPYDDGYDDGGGGGGGGGCAKVWYFDGVVGANNIIE